MDIRIMGYDSMITMPKSRPMIFNSESVRAILDGRKTQSRRTRGLNQLNDPASKSLWHLLRTEGDTWTFTHPSLNFDHAVIKCPYGIPGSELWVRETFFYEWPTEEPPENMQDCRIVYKASEPDYINEEMREYDRKQYRWSPSIHMPKWASRITLEIKDVRVERVKEISEVGAVDEGIMALSDTWVYKNFPDYGRDYQEWREKGNSRFPPPLGISPRQKFAKFWDIINAKKGFGWDTDPWVWVLEFEVMKNG